jgi:hypothetical protein
LAFEKQLPVSSVIHFVNSQQIAKTIRLKSEINFFFFGIEGIPIFPYVCTDRRPTSAKKAQREVNRISSRKERERENGWTGGSHYRVAREIYNRAVTERMRFFNFCKKIRADRRGKRNWSQS